MTDRLIARLDFRGIPLDRRTLATRLPRAALGAQAAADAVLPILEQVRAGGREALLDLTERFDGVRPGRVFAPADAIESAVRSLEPATRAALEESIARQRRVSAAQRPADRTTELAAGARVTDRWLPVERVGLYVPGGRAVYPSTVVMNVVPAQEAGVDALVIASPPGPDGLPHRDVLAAAGLLGVETVLIAGGAQAIGALAYGFDPQDGESLEPVDLITGPGNAFVAAAKAQVRGIVGIDAVAGPTEIIVLADDSAQPALIAADLISQAEHDPQAAAVLVSPSAALLEAVEAELARQVPQAEHRERIVQALAGEQSALILVDDLEAGIAVTNAYAGEHVEVMTGEPAAVAARITKGGAVFLGDHSPVSLGDYCSGSNHVLPTMGTAAFSSGLGVPAFMRRSQVIDYDREALAEVAGHVETLARVEGLPAHGAAVTRRFGGEA
ncbi:histidinol dehydrogenase [Sediminivirga luteola]|uniref:histidinol dehydrogenase n=1 Tax=Sediminivirga luteola TaxID=1774748 RepID=UPI001F5994A0|nr:histidinol dehydrogenase [Sediminivirga luteola]MCI2264305.1 histidinol dehydrogenase [Sediminivirga luteola]